MRALFAIVCFVFFLLAGVAWGIAQGLYTRLYGCQSPRLERLMEQIEMVEIACRMWVSRP